MLLPSVLLVAAGTAFGGLAVLPASAGTDPARVSAAAAIAPVPLAAPAAAAANVALYSALSQGLAVANKPKPVVKPAPRPAAAKASRDRKPVGTIAQSARAARPGVGRLTSGYGRRWGRLHAGIDLAAGIGSPVRAAEAGTVLSSGNEGGYGRCVRITHADGTVTVYAHMSALLVNDGERVEAGDQIGREGNTGHSTGPHLHFEVHVNGSPTNPIPWLTRRGIVL